MTTAPLELPASGDAQVEIDGRTIKLTNLDKVMYPATGSTKRDVISYYAAVAPWFVPHAARRPATRKRWVNGVGTASAPGKAFFHKNMEPKSTPDWVRRITLQHSDDAATYPLVDDAATLVWLAQLAALEIHIPQWRVDAEDEPQHPDRLVLDLDPGEGAGIGECIELAFLIREVLDGMEMPSVPVTSGNKGIHLYAHLDGSLTSADASELARQLAQSLEGMHPGLVVSNMKKTVREGKVLLDWSQNNGNKTTIAPYSLRGKERPTVALPRTWDELGGTVDQVLFSDVLDRLNAVGDPMSVLLPDRLTTYRAKRDAARTPEPVPEASPEIGTGDAFVIQEHHARRLHYDFRLEHEGVLVSWAIPKGPPTDPQQNHLAVQTEDHPLEYRTFEGEIPKGEYGGGTVSIWDSGRYTTEKWRDGREVIAVLHGRADGGLGGVPRRFALIHTGHGKADQNWLIHLMEPPAMEPPAASAEQPAGAGPPGKPPLIEPMLATAGSASDLTGDWHYEVKWDGYRAIATVHEGTVSWRSRRGLDFGSTYPELAELASLVGEHQVVLDGEIVALDEVGRPRFELLQNHGSGQAPAHYMAFDLLHLDGESLLRTPYLERRARLEEVLATEGRHIHVPTTFGEDRELALNASAEFGLEGVVAKRPDSVYQPGRRAHTWIKVKHRRAQEVIVVGWRPSEAGPARPIGSLLLGVMDDKELRYAGKVGSGFSDRGIAEARDLLVPLARETAPLDGVPREDARGAHWVEPALVGEVEYAEWSSTGRLRQPVWRGWRPDKEVEDAVRVVDGE